MKLLFKNAFYDFVALYDNTKPNKVRIQYDKVCIMFDRIIIKYYKGILHNFIYK